MIKGTRLSLVKAIDRWLQGVGPSFPVIISLEELHQEYGAPEVRESKRVCRKGIKSIENYLNSDGFEWVVFYSKGFICFEDIEDLVEKKTLARMHRVCKKLQKARELLHTTDGLVDDAQFVSEWG